MRRTLITTFAVLAILLQGLSTAWAAPAHLVAQQEQSSGTPHEMPCHQHKADSSSHGCCCGEHCACDNVCGVASAALPMQMPELDDYIAAHFEALQIAPTVFPAHALNRLRPPISHAS